MDAGTGVDLVGLFYRAAALPWDFARLRLIAAHPQTFAGAWRPT